MKDYSNMTVSQKKGTYEILNNCRTLTPSELSFIKNYESEFGRIENSEKGNVLVNWDKMTVELLHQYRDCFGEDYRFRKVKLQESSKGYFFIMEYLNGRKRIYLK